MRFLTALCVLGVIGMCSGANILSLLVMPSRSHGILMERLIRELASRGHTITYITASPQMKDSNQNITVIHVPQVEEAIQAGMGHNDNFNMMDLKDSSAWFMFFFTLAAPTMAEAVMEDARVQKLRDSNEKFDLILAEAFLDEAIIAGFAHRFQAPIVGVMAFMPNIWGNYLVGNPAQTSYIPDPTLGLTSTMTFRERIFNFVYTTAWDLFHPYVYLRSQDKVMKKYFGEDTPDIRGILKNTSLVLVNHHFALGFPRPLLPNMVEVGGMHINPVKPLPEDLKKYLDASKQGVILFSMGSNIRSADLTPELKESILRAFAKLPYNVLWKFEEEMANLPKNVQIGKWLPQSDILAHENLKLFITHGGLLSTTEAVHRGVPVLGIPIFGDQPLNMKHTENAGLGKQLDIRELNEHTFYDKIMEITANPKFAAAAKLKSSLFKDNMASPLKRAVWWIEYVLRHDGAPHLRSTAQNLPYYQVHQLDVLAVLLVGTVLVAYISLVILKALIRCCCSKSKPTANKSKNKSKKNN